MDQTDGCCIIPIRIMRLAVEANILKVSVWRKICCTLEENITRSDQYLARHSKIPYKIGAHSFLKNSRKNTKIHLPNMFCNGQKTVIQIMTQLHVLYLCFKLF